MNHSTNKPPPRTGGRAISAKLSKSSIHIYSRTCTKLITYLLEKKTHLINKQYKNELNKYTSIQEQHNYIYDSIFSYSGMLPLNFSLFCAQDFYDWIKTLENPNGNYICAIKHCYRVHGFTICPSFEKDMRASVKSASTGSRKSSDGGIISSSSAGSGVGKRKWNQGSISVSGNSISTRNSFVQNSSSLLTTPNNAIDQNNHQANSTNKEKKRITEENNEKEEKQEPVTITAGEDVIDLSNERPTLIETLEQVEVAWGVEKKGNYTERLVRVEKLLYAVSKPGCVKDRIGKLASDCLGIVGGSENFSQNGVVAYKNGELLAMEMISSFLGEDNIKRIANWIIKYLADVYIPFKVG